MKCIVMKWTYYSYRVFRLYHYSLHRRVKVKLMQATFLVQHRNHPELLLLYKHI